MTKENGETGLLEDGNLLPNAPAPGEDPPPPLPDPPADAALPAASPPADDSPDYRLLALEERVRRLEDALAQAQDVHAIETRVAERVTDRITRNASSTAILSAEPTDRSKPSFTPLSSPAGRPNLLFDLLADARAIWRCYTDPRYRLTWVGRLAPPVLAVLFLTSQYWLAFTSIPFVGTLIDKVICLVLAFVLFKLLFHEARRYRQTAPDLPASLRL